MTEQEIIEYLKQNKDKGVAFGFMPKEVQDWCGFHSPAKIFKVFDGFWSDSCYVEHFVAKHIYCLSEDYEPKPEWQTIEYDINEYGLYNVGEGESIPYFDYVQGLKRLMTIHNLYAKDVSFGGWLCADGKWRTYQALYWRLGDVECYNGTCGDNYEPVIFTKIRFWRRKK